MVKKEKKIYKSKSKINSVFRFSEAINYIINISYIVLIYFLFLVLYFNINYKYFKKENRGHGGGDFTVRPSLRTPLLCTSSATKSKISPYYNDAKKYVEKNKIKTYK